MQQQLVGASVPPVRAEEAGLCCAALHMLLHVPQNAALIAQLAWKVRGGLSLIVRFLFVHCKQHRVVSTNEQKYTCKFYYSKHADGVSRGHLAAASHGRITPSAQQRSYLEHRACAAGDFSVLFAVSCDQHRSLVCVSSQRRLPVLRRALPHKTAGTPPWNHLSRPFNAPKQSLRS